MPVGSLAQTIRIGQTVRIVLLNWEWCCGTAALRDTSRTYCISNVQYDTTKS